MGDEVIAVIRARDRPEQGAGELLVEAVDLRLSIGDHNHLNQGVLRTPGETVEAVSPRLRRLVYRAECSRPKDLGSATVVAHPLGAAKETDSAALCRRCGGEQGEARDLLARDGLDRGYPGVDRAPQIDAC